MIIAFNEQVIDNFNILFTLTCDMGDVMVI